MIFKKSKIPTHFHGPNMIPHIFFSKVICNRFFIFILLANHLHLLSIQMPSIRCLSIEFWRGQGRKMYISGSCLKKKKTLVLEVGILLSSNSPRLLQMGKQGRNSWEGSHGRSLARSQPEPLRGRPEATQRHWRTHGRHPGTKTQTGEWQENVSWWFHFKVFRS